MWSAVKQLSVKPTDAHWTTTTTNDEWTTLAVAGFVRVRQRHVLGARGFEMSLHRGSRVPREGGQNPAADEADEDVFFKRRRSRVIHSFVVFARRLRRRVTEGYAVVYSLVAQSYSCISTVVQSRSCIYFDGRPITFVYLFRRSSIHLRVLARLRRRITKAYARGLLDGHLFGGGE